MDLTLKLLAAAVLIIVVTVIHGTGITLSGKLFNYEEGELKRRNLLFLDSRTIGNTVGDKLAARMGVAHVMRDVFLDNEMDQAAVIKQLMQAERVAASKGQAIAIGHPHPATIAAIRAWMPKAEARGFVIVPLSAVAKLRLGASG